MDQDQDFAVTVSISNTDAELSILDLNALNAGVDKANLFFSAWGALISALLLVTRHFELYFKREDDKHLYHWVGFATAGIIIMSDTARFWKTYKCKDFEDNEICNRNMFALILGAFSCVVGLAMVLAPIPLFFAQLTSSVMLVAWCCGISYLTFDEGPAIHQGIIYFASWASLLFVLAVAAPALLELFHTLSGRDAAPSAVEAEVLPTKEEVVEMKGGGDEAEEEEIAEKEGTETA